MLTFLSVGEQDFKIVHEMSVSLSHTPRTKHEHLVFSSFDRWSSIILRLCIGFTFPFILCVDLLDLFGSFEQGRHGVVEYCVVIALYSEHLFRNLAEEPEAGSKWVIPDPKGTPWCDLPL